MDARATGFIVNGMIALVLSLAIWEMTASFWGWLTLFIPGVALIIWGWVILRRTE